MSLKYGIEKLMRGENLSSVDCEQALNEMFSKNANPLQMSAFLVLLHSKKETAEELSVIVKKMRQHMISVDVQTPVLDIVGTGGDKLNTVNISTGAAMLAASCGIKVAKHGSTASSSLAGSADVLQVLGVNIHATPAKIARSINEINIGFCFAPNFHPLIQSLRQFRKQLNVPTTFNILGTLLNPAHAAHYILGVYNESLMPVMAEVLLQSGCDRSMVVHSSGMDEINCVGPAKIIEISKGKMTERILDPLEFGFPRCSIADLQGGDAKMNAALLMDTFRGKNTAIGNTLILNAAVALYIYGMTSSIEMGVSQAKENLHNGAVINLLNNWVELSNEQ